MKVEEKKVETATKESTSKDTKDKEKEKEKEKEVIKDPDTLTFEDIKENVKYLERGIQTKETRYLIRVMRTLFSTRKRLNDPVLKRILNYYFITASSAPDKEFLMTFIDTSVASTSLAAGGASSAIAVK